MSKKRKLYFVECSWFRLEGIQEELNLNPEAAACVMTRLFLPVSLSGLTDDTAKNKIMTRRFDELKAARLRENDKLNEYEMIRLTIVQTVNLKPGNAAYQLTKMRCSSRQPNEPCLDPLIVTLIKGQLESAFKRRNLTGASLRCVDCSEELWNRFSPRRNSTQRAERTTVNERQRQRNLLTGAEHSDVSKSSVREILSGGFETNRRKH